MFDILFLYFFFILEEEFFWKKVVEMNFDEEVYFVSVSIGVD